LEEVTTQETTEQPTSNEDSAIIDYGKVDFNNVDENGVLKNFDEVVIKPEKQEKTEKKQETETINETTEKVEDNLEDDSTKEEVPIKELNTEDFSSIEEHFDFLNQGMDEKVETPLSKKEETVQPKQPEIKETVEEKTEEKPYREQVLEQINGVKNVYETFMARNNGNWELAKQDADDYFERQAREAESEQRINERLKQLDEREERARKAEEIQASLPQYHANINEISREKKWKNSQQLHDYMYDPKGGGEFMTFLFNFKHPENKNLSTQDLKQKWQDFNVEFGSNKKNLEFAEKMMRTILIGKNYSKVVSKQVAAKLKNQKDVNSGLNMQSKTNRNVAVNSPSKMSPTDKWFRT